MRILYQAGVDLSLPQGNAVHVRRLVDSLESLGPQVRLLTPKLSRRLDWSGPSAGWIRAGALPLPRMRHLTRESRLAWLMRREAERLPADIRLVRQELFCFSPLLQPRGRFAASEDGRRAPRGGAAPLVLEIHASHGDLTSGDGSRLRARGARTLEGLALRRAGAVVAVTEPLASALIEGHRLDPRRVHVIPNGAWIPPLLRQRISEVRLRHGADRHDFVAAFAGNLNHVQDLETVLAAVAALRDLPLRLWIAGDGMEKGALQRQAHALRIDDRVSFLGGLAEEEAAGMLQAAQVVLVPYRRDRYESLGGEGEALKLLQGMACDRPLLVSRARGLDLVERLEAGCQVRPRAGDAGAQAWADALHDWAGRWARDGRPLQDWPWPEGAGPGRRYVAGSRTWERCAESWIALFEQLIGSER